MNTNRKGYFILFEGIDGMGKSTQAKKLYDALISMGYKAVMMREPTDGAFGKAIRERLKSGFKNDMDETLLFTMDRFYDVAFRIHNWLSQEDRVIVMDRYYYSSIAYQGAKGVDADYLREINRMFAPEPDVVFLLDAPPHVGLDRKDNNKMEKDTFENEEYLTRVRKLFLAEAATNKNFVVVDASRSEESVHAEIIGHMLQRARGDKPGGDRPRPLVREELE